MNKLLLILTLCASTLCAQNYQQDYQNRYESYQLAGLVQQANYASFQAAARFPQPGPNKYISIYYKDPEHKNPPLLLLFYFGSSVDMSADCSSLDGLRLILKWYYGTVYGN